MSKKKSPVLFEIMFVPVDPPFERDGRKLFRAVQMHFSSEQDAALYAANLIDEWVDEGMTPMRVESIVPA